MPSYFSPMQMLRMQNLLGGLGGMKPPDEPEYSVSDRLSQLYNPSTHAMDAYLGAAQNMPQRDNYQPSRMRKIGAVIAGIGAGSGPAAVVGGSPIGFRGDPKSAYQVSSSIADAPFQEATEDWARNLHPLQAAAQQEEMRNRNDRTFAEQTIQRDINSMRERRLAKEGEKKLGQKDEQLRIADYRAKAYDWDKRHPNWMKVALPGQTLKFVNPDNPNEVFDTKWPTDMMTDEEKINLKAKHTMEEIEKRGKIGIDTVNAHGVQTRETKTTPAAGIGPTNEETVVTDKSGAVVGKKAVTRTRPNASEPKMPTGFYKGQRIKSRSSNKMGTIDGINPDGTPKIIWDK